MLGKLIDKNMIAAGTLQARVELPEAVYFQPGDYAYFNLLKPKYTDKKGSERHFSLVDSPRENKILTIATRLRDSAFKRSLNEMEIGDELAVYGIAGEMHLPSNGKKVVMIAGGIGITPFISMIRQINLTDLDYDVCLLYANPDQASLAFGDELKGYATTMQNFRLELVLSDEPGWKGESGRIDNEMINRLVPDYRERYFMVSGPPAMVEGLAKILRQMGVRSNDIGLDKFIGY